MSESQLDFFSDMDIVSEQSASPHISHALVPAQIDDATLIAAIPESSLADSAALAAEAGRRHLAAAVPALADLCRRFAGFGTRRMVGEQVAALQALAMIGGRDAAHAVAEMIERAVVQGPTLHIAVSTAARLRATLSSHAVQQLLRHDERGVRAEACRCARARPELIRILTDLLEDLDSNVAMSAACALGRMGRIEARPILKRLLRENPTPDAIDAAASIADAECAVLLRRLARTRPDLAEAVLASLGVLDDADAVASAIFRR
jgi:HEAT repeat protein